MCPYHVSSYDYVTNDFFLISSLRNCSRKTQTLMALSNPVNNKLSIRIDFWARTGIYVTTLNYGMQLPIGISILMNPLNLWHWWVITSYESLWGSLIQDLNVIYVIRSVTPVNAGSTHGDNCDKKMSIHRPICSQMQPIYVINAYKKNMYSFHLYLTNYNFTAHWRLLKQYMLMITWIMMITLLIPTGNNVDQNI